MHLREEINKDLLTSEVTGTAHSFPLLHCPTGLIDLHLMEASGLCVHQYEQKSQSTMTVSFWLQY